MLVLVAGIIIFLGAHTLGTFPETRSALIGRAGAGAYKFVHSVASLTDLALSYRAEGPVQIWTPPPWASHLALVLMWFVFASVACIDPAPGRIRGWLRHPMLVAIKIWALAHLLANGGAGGMLLFGSALAWAIFDRVAVKRRGDKGAPRLASFTRADRTALGAGTVAYVAMILLHPVLIGVSVIGM